MIKQAMLNRISNGITRSSIQSCSKWAEHYRVMGKPFAGKWSFHYHPWLKAMHNSTARTNVGRKSSQMGFSETLLNWIFYHIDILGESSLYVLPTSDDASDFSASRFDPALELSPHLSSLFSDVKNMGHKRAGSASLFVRGSRSRSKLKSVPVANLALDEMDEMVLANIPLVLERLSGQVEKMMWFVSTPTDEGIGIDEFYQKSNQQNYFFSCPHCSKFISLEYPRNINNGIVDSTLEANITCHLCKAKITQEEKITSMQEKDEWVTVTKGEDDVLGWHVNHLYSYTVSPREIISTSRNSPIEEKEFYNSKLGLPYTPKGAKVTDQEIKDLIRDFTKVDFLDNIVITTMGVDVGTKLHYEIDSYNNDKVKLVTEGTVTEFEELDRLMNDFKINHCVIDANPERRKATEFANRFFGGVHLCFYGRGLRGKTISENEADSTITVDRTSWIDLALSRFHNKGIDLPKDLSMEYQDHIKSLIRTLIRDADGNPVARFINRGNDHFAHARTYSEIALTFATGIGSENIKRAIL